MSNEKPEALELADIFENLAHPTGTRYRAATELRRQHARIQELEAMLESAGAGGVSAQRVTQDKWASDPSKMLRIKAIQKAADHIEQTVEMVAAPVEVVIDFERVGSAGPFAVEEGRVAIPVVTMLDLARMLKPTTDALSAAPVVLPEPVAVIENGSLKWKIPTGEYSIDVELIRGLHNLYTEQQVRELLAGVSAPAAQAESQPVAWRYQTPTGWHATTDTSAAARVNKHHAIQPLYVAPPPQADALDAERWRFIKRKLCLSGNGDGTCAMQALNLPARILGWPDVGELAIAQFLDAAIDAAIAAAKGKSK